MEPIVSLRGLEKKFKGIKAVDGLGFDVFAGDIYGFLGQNGAGKSTTLRILLSLIRPDAGTVSIFGKDLFSNRKECLSQVGAVIERPDLYKYLSAYENLSVFARLSGIRLNRKQLLDQLERVGLAERADSPVKQFSQGMKQRLGIAVALVHDPQLLVLDEPTNGLDPQGIADIRNMILHLCHERGKTILLSSHLLSEIEQIATRMIIIDKGRMVIEGKTTELFDPNQSRVMLSVTQPEAARNHLERLHWKTFLLSEEGAAIALQMPLDQVPALTRDLVMAGFDILSIQPTHSLEAYFLSLTAGKQHVASFTN